MGFSEVVWCSMTYPEQTDARLNFCKVSEDIYIYIVYILCNKSENFNYLNVAFISYKLTMWN